MIRGYDPHVPGGYLENIGSKRTPEFKPNGFGRVISDSSALVFIRNVGCPCEAFRISDMGGEKDEKPDWTMAAYSEAYQSIRSFYDNLFSLTRTSVAVNGFGIAALAVPIVVKNPCGFATGLDPILFYVFSALIGSFIGLFGVVFTIGARDSQNYLRIQILYAAQTIIDIEYLKKINFFTKTIDKKLLRKFEGHPPILNKKFSIGGRVHKLTRWFFRLASLIWVSLAIIIILFPAIQTAACQANAASGM